MIYLTFLVLFQLHLALVSHDVRSITFFSPWKEQYAHSTYSSGNIIKRASLRNSNALSDYQRAFLHQIGCRSWALLAECQDVAMDNCTSLLLQLHTDPTITSYKAQYLLGKKHWKSDMSRKFNAIDVVQLHEAEQAWGVSTPS